MLDRKYTVAVIDDNVGDAELLRRTLQQIPELDVDFLYFGDPDRGLDALLRQTVDFIFVDYRLGAKTGLHVLQSFREAGNLRAIIILAGESEGQLVAQFMRAGADDYLVKCDLQPGILLRSLKHSHERYLRREAEKNQRELLTKTLAGSVRMLVDLLSTAKPKAFGRAVRVQKLVQQMCHTLNLDNAWEVDIAAMLSQFGCAFVDDEILEKVEQERPLTPDEEEQFYQHPAMTSEMLRRIPHLGGVAYQEMHFDGAGHPVGGLMREKILFGARILKVALDFDALVNRGSTTEDSIQLMRDRRGWYDLNCLDALESALLSQPTEEAEYEIQQVTLEELEPHMILEEHLETKSGSVIVPKGDRVSAARRERLTSLVSIEPLRLPVSVRIPRRYVLMA